MILGLYGNQSLKKATLIEKIICELTPEYDTVTVRHMHREFLVKTDEQDTRPQGKGKASVIVVSSDSETSFVLNESLSLDEITKIIDDIASPDLVLVEDCQDTMIPNIALGDVEPRKSTLFCYDDNLGDIIEYIRSTIEAEKVFEKLPKLNCGKCGYDCKTMSKLISKGEKNYTDCIIGVGSGDLVINVDGRSLAVGGFVEEIFKSTILGMVSSLKGVKGVGNPQEIKINVRYDNLKDTL